MCRTWPQDFKVHAQSAFSHNNSSKRTILLWAAMSICLISTLAFAFYISHHPHTTHSWITQSIHTHAYTTHTHTIYIHRNIQTSLTHTSEIQRKHSYTHISHTHHKQTPCKPKEPLMHRVHIWHSHKNLMHIISIYIHITHRSHPHSYLTHTWK